jgi:hypothetical protein
MSWKEYKKSTAQETHFLQIYHVLKANHNRPMTASEVQAKSPFNGLWKRFSQLRQMGKVEECQIRKCKITGRLAVTWKLCIA